MGNIVIPVPDGTEATIYADVIAKNPQIQRRDGELDVQLFRRIERMRYRHIHISVKGSVAADAARASAITDPVDPIISITD